MTFRPGCPSHFQVSENGWGNSVETSCFATLTAGVVRKNYYYAYVCMSRSSSENRGVFRSASDQWRRRTVGLSTLLGTLRLLGQTTMLSRFLRSQREKISVLHVECSWGAIWANVDRRNASMDLCSSCPRGLKTWRRRGVFDRTSWRAQSHSALSGRTGCWRLFVYNRSGSTNWRRR